MTDCIFCKIVAGEIPARVVYEDQYCIAFLDVNPATTGHTLVVSKQHVADFFEASEEQAAQVMAALHHVALLLKGTLEPAGLNIIQSNGAAAWQEIFHLHFHLVPRYEGDGLPSPWSGGGSSDDLDATLARIKDASKSE